MNAMIILEFSKIRNKLETMDKRLVKLERRKPKAPKPAPAPVPTFNYELRPYHDAKPYHDATRALERLNAELATHTEPQVRSGHYQSIIRVDMLTSSARELFLKFLSRIFEEPSNVNVDVVGKRIYRYTRAGWRLVHDNKKFLGSFGSHQFQVFERAWERASGEREDKGVWASALRRLHTSKPDTSYLLKLFEDQILAKQHRKAFG